MNKNIFFFNKRRLITFGLIVFIIFVVYSQSSNALLIQVNKPYGETWLQGTNQTIDYNIQAGASQSDFNTSILGSIYYSKIAGARTNLITTKSPLFETVNPDANSNSWVWNSSGINYAINDTTTYKDGSSSFQYRFCVTGEPCNTAIYYSRYAKYIPDTNFSDINKNGGKIVLWAKMNNIDWKHYQVFIIGFMRANGDYIAETQDGTPDFGTYDANNTWTKFTWDLNKLKTFNEGFEKNKVGKIAINARISSGGYTTDLNVWIDGIRIYDNHNCVSFDGNQEKNTNCTHSWTLPASGDLNNLYVDANISNGTTTSQDSSCFNGACSNAPTITTATIDVNQNFSLTPTTTGSISLRCTDGEPGDLNYTITLNDTNILTSQDANNTLKTIDTNFSFGENKITFYCKNSPGFSATTTKNTTIYSTKFTLIDEDTAGNFDINRNYYDTSYSDINSIKAFSANRQASLDLNMVAPIRFYYSAQDKNYITVEIRYNDSLNQKIVKYLNVSLLDENVNVCAAHFQQFYQQIFVSYAETPVWLVNQFANCYIVADYTKFAYKNALSVQGSTINKPYLLETRINNQKIILSSQDGSLASEINLDALIFQKTTTSILSENDYIAFSPYFNETTEEYDQNVLQISYQNIKSENESVALKIYKNNSLLQTITETSAPNNFVYDWNYSSHNLDQNDILKMIIEKTLTDGTTDTYITYFNLQATYSAETILNDWTAIILAALLLLVGLTMVATRFALGWFGLLICIAAIGLLSLAPPFWYVQFFQIIIAIIGIFIGFVYKSENLGVK